jgi:hypothetical protein
LAHEKLEAAEAAAYGWPTGLAADQILERRLKLNRAHLDTAAGIVAANLIRGADPAAKMFRGCNHHRPWGASGHHHQVAPPLTPNRPANHCNRSTTTLLQL